MVGKQVKYWLLIIIVSYVPVIAIEMLERTLWYHTALGRGTIGRIEGLFIIFIFPAYLVRMNYLFAKKHNKKTALFIINSFIVLHCICIAAALGRASYAGARGVVEDAEDFAFVWNTLEWAAAAFVSLIWIITAFINLNIKHQTPDE